MPIDVLVAEDDQVSRDILCRILENEAGNRVIRTADGLEAWESLSAPGRHFDLAILDIMMPRLSGLELAERIRNTPALRAMPIVFCTALHDRTTVFKAASLGVHHYIVKPIDKRVVAAKLRAALGPTAAPEPAAAPTG